MDKPKLTFAEGAKLPQFDMPIDFIVYDDIRSNLLKFYASFPCKIDACVICFVESGELVATINLRDYNIKAGDLVMLLPGSFIQVNEVSDDTKIAFAGFSAGFLRQMDFWDIVQPVMANILQRPVYSLDEGLASIYHDFFGLMTRASVFDDTFQGEEIGRSSMTFLVGSLHNAIKAGRFGETGRHTSREQVILSEFMQLAFENYRDEHKISFYAHEAKLTLSHFCNVISKSTGQTPQEIISNMIILDAKAQLKGTKATVSRIASTLGFNTATAFNRYFKTYAGMTPLEYRNS